MFIDQEWVLINKTLQILSIVRLRNNRIFWNTFILIIDYALSTFNNNNNNNKTKTRDGTNKWRGEKVLYLNLK